MFTYDVKTVNEYTREITGEIGKENVENQIEKVCRELKRELFVPGFRKGKVPISMLKRRFANEIKEQVIEELFQENYPKIIEQAKLHPIDKPNIHELDYEDGKPLKFKFSSEVIVMDEPKDYTGVEITVEPTVVEDKEIEEYINSLRYRRGEIQVVENRPVEKEDLIILDIEALCGDEKIESYDREKIQLQVGKNGYISDPRFDEQLVGLKQGKKKKFELEFSDEDENEELKGKKISFSVFVHEIKAIVLPELDDEFAKSLGEYETLADLNEKIKESFTEQKKSQNQEIAIEMMIDKILEKNDIILPPRFIDDYSNDLTDRYIERTGIQIDSEEMKAEFDKQAERELKKMVLINKVAEKEKIEVSDEEVDKVVQTLGKFYQQSGKRDMKDAIESIRNNLKESKTIEFLFDNTVKETIEQEKDKKASDKDTKKTSKDSDKTTKNSKQDTGTKTKEDKSEEKEEPSSE